jgi:hypothetical protein
MKIQINTQELGTWNQRNSEHRNGTQGTEHRMIGNRHYTQPGVFKQRVNTLFREERLKLKLRDLHVSHTLGCMGDWDT